MNGKSTITLLVALLALTMCSAPAWAAQKAEAAKPVDSIARMVDDGVAKYKAGDLAGALELFTNAMEARPGMAQAVYGRAAVQFIMGKFDESSQTLQKWIGDNQGDAFAWMWAYIDNARHGLGDRSALTDMQSLTDESSWLGMTLKLFLGQATPEEYISEVRNSVANSGRGVINPSVIRAEFMAGETTLLAGDKKAAAAHFQAAIDANGPFMWEREMAKAELARINSGSPAGASKGGKKK